MVAALIDEYVRLRDAGPGRAGVLLRGGVGTKAPTRSGLLRGASDPASRRATPGPAFEYEWVPLASVGRVVLLAVIESLRIAAADCGLHRTPALSFYRSRGSGSPVLFASETALRGRADLRRHAIEVWSGNTLRGAIATVAHETMHLGLLRSGLDRDAEERVCRRYGVGFAQRHAARIEAWARAWAAR